MLDEDLAALYDVEIKVLNQAVKRNLDRFPADFMFQLSAEEFADLRSQSDTSSLRSQIVTLKSGRGQHRKYMPYAFKELRHQQKAPKRFYALQQQVKNASTRR